MEKSTPKPKTCPDCGGKVMYYHSSVKSGDGMTRIVCRKKCKGWKVLEEYERGPQSI